MSDELEALEVSFTANIDDLAAASAAIDSIFANVAESAAASGAGMSESLTATAEGFSSLSEAASQISTGVEEGVAGATEALGTLPSVGEEAGASLAESISQTASGFGDLQGSIASLVSSVDEAVSEIDSRLESIGAAAEESASVAQNAGNNFNLGGMINQAGLTIFSLQNLGNMAAQTAGALLGPAASAETVDSALSTLLGSTSAASDELNKLDAFASKTPFKTLDIDQAAEQLIGFKTKASDVVPDITAIGDALGAVGRDTPAELNSVVNLFGKMQVTGKVTQATITELGIHGIDALGAIARGANKSQAEIQEMIKHGTLPATEAIKDLTTGIEANPMLAGGMARAAGTFTGLMSTLASNWDQLMASFGSPIIAGLEPVLNNLGNALTSPGFKTFAGGVGQGIVLTFQLIGGAVAPVTGLFSHFGDVMQSMPVQVFVSSVDALGKNLGGLFDELGGVVKTVEGMFTPALDSAGGKIKSGLGQALFVVDDIIIQVGYGVKDFSKVLMGVNFGPIVDDAQQIGSVLGGTFSGGLKLIGDLFQAIGPGIQTTASILGGQFKTDLQFVGNLFTQVGGWIKSDLMPAISSLEPPFVSIAGTIATNVIPALAILYATGHQIAEAVFPPIIAVVEKVIPPVVRFAAVIGTGLAIGFKLVAPLVLDLAKGIQGLVGFFTQTELGGDILKATLVALAIPVGVLAIGFTVLAVQAVAGFIAAIPGMITGFVASAAGAWGLAAGVIAATWPILAIIAVIVGIIELIQHFGQVMSFVGHLAGTIFGGMASFFQSAGQNINNVFLGIANVINGVGDTIRDVFKGAVNTVIGGINWLINAIDSFNISIPPLVVAGVTVFGGVDLSLPHIPDIPLLARGGVVPPGQFAIAGETGKPEVVYGGTSGASVLGVQQTAALMSGGGGDVHVHNHIYLDSREMTNTIMTRAVKEIRAQGGRMVAI